ncbi:alcohol dehydrogenase catalytic domain-containing protein [Cryptosporangium minutisporangium]|uniref:alcohol dehydrogenase catalytic domain-containing protein n=1 Tax=Cryptosporangium minutisporangium TaxID=113569 RepID=UPI0035ED967E
MRAARLHGPRDLRVETVPDPVPGPDEVLLRPLYTGLCGSDLHVWHGGAGAADGAPMVLGHEFSAEVVSVGPAAGDVRPGTLVTVEPMWTCGGCAPCRRGDYHLCRAMQWHGLSARTGALADRTVVRASMVHVLPEGVDARQGALVEPIAVAHHAVARANLTPGGSALVIGAGPIGVACALDLLARGVRRIVVSEPSPVRRVAAARAFAAVGAPDVLVLDPGADDVPDAVRALTGGEGTDAVLDAAGVQAAFTLALAAVRPGGRVVTVAVYLEPVSFHPLTTFLGEVDLVASCGYRDDFPAVLDLVRDGRFPLTDLVRTVPLEAVGDAFAELEAGTALKVLVQL